MKARFILPALLALAALGLQGAAQSARQVVVNEIAWAGSAASPNDEWIELYNNSDRNLDLTGWVLRWEGVVIHFGPAPEGAANNAQDVRTTTVPARGYYLLERTDDTSVGDVEADLIFTGSLRNGGETLELLDAAGAVVDTANGPAEAGWLGGAAGDGEVPYATMERINTQGADSADNWAGNNGRDRSGLDADGNALNATPKARNSAR